MYHGENAFTLSWRQLWGCNSPSGYKNKFSARVVIISASVSFFLCSERIESLWQGLQISKHRGILSLSPQGLAFMCSHSSRLPPFPLLQNQDPHECPLPMAGRAPLCQPRWWEGDPRLSAASLQGSGGSGVGFSHAGRRDVHMALPGSGKYGLSPPWGEERGKKKKKKEKTCFIRNSFEESA